MSCGPRSGLPMIVGAGSVNAVPGALRAMAEMEDETSLSPWWVGPPFVW
ncbi:hypothetical protein AQZ59_01295 [Trueperella bernardiae]|uniref:Uncharacterized protein n=1 Tax=Trueperella bernardiae TaxID=59561 RepID=A0A0W1KJV2_9ACTO|nr:hypothetical protein AQZ59_01295 [Trueperella bernardiae]